MAFGIQPVMSCEEKVRQIQFRLKDRLETVRAGIESYSALLEKAEAQTNYGLARHTREIITIFEAEEKETMAVLEIAEPGSDELKLGSSLSLFL